MTSGLVLHNITTASGVSFTVASWVPDTAAPDVGAVPVQIITDGTRVAALKAASTAPGATDIALVVAISPNTPVLPVSGTLKTTFGTATAFTKTNANLANSLTAAWKSQAIDNTLTRATDALIGIELAAVNTAPSAPSTLYIFAYGLIEGTAYASTGDGTIDGTEGTVTVPSVTTLPSVLKLIGTISYPVQNKAINQVFRWCGGQNDLPVLPDKWGIVIVNATGMTISVTNIYYKEIFKALV